MTMLDERAVDTAIAPGPTLPPPRDDDSALEAIRAAIAWEYRRRLAGGVVARPEEHSHAFAVVALAVLVRGGWLGGLHDSGYLFDGEVEDVRDFLDTILTDPVNGGTVPEDPDPPEDYR